MGYKSLVLAAVFMYCSTSTVCAVPSFDCAEASGTVEELICQDEELSQLDQRLAEIYSAAINRLPQAEHATTRAMQRGWIKGRNDCWKAGEPRACVQASYQTRIVELQIAGGLLEVPDYHLFICHQDEGKPFTVVFYNQTEPPSAVLTWGDDQVIAFIKPTASGAHYMSSGVDFWSHQGEARVDWYGKRLQCLSAAGQAKKVSDDSASLEGLHNASYQGFDGVSDSITLHDGQWQGEPYVEGGAVVAHARIVGELLARGDLDGDGLEESVVLINFAPGGTGEFLYLAVVQKRKGSLENIATTLVGDRPRVRSLAIKEKKIFLELVQAGAKDPLCCPGDVVTRQWTFDQRGLVESTSEPMAGRL